MLGATTRPPGDWSGLVVVCAGTPWDGIPFPERHLAQHLASHAPVLYVDPPMSAMHAGGASGVVASMRAPRLELVAPSVVRFTPVVNPGPTRPGLRRLSRRLHRRALRSAVRVLCDRPRAVIAACTDDVLDAVGADVRVFYATDDFTAGAALMGVSQRWLQRAEARQLRKADFVVAISDVLADRLRAEGITTHTIPNGVEADRYYGCDDAPVPVEVRLPRPCAGFIGHLSERIDPRLLESVADAGVSVLLVGPRQRTLRSPELERLLSRPDVQWVGPKPFESLPSYLRCMDVGLTPYRNTEFNRASFPLKTLEYLAGGRPVVTTDLPVNAMLDPRLISVEDDPEAFAAAVRRHAESPIMPSDAAQRRAFAAQHTWRARAQQMAELVGMPVSGSTAESGGAT